MRVLLFFDLPTDTPRKRKDYTRFRKFLINEGFIMMQYSVYMKLAINNTAAKNAISRVRKNAPPFGDVFALKVTERQFSRMDYILGNGVRENEKISSDQRLIFLGADND